MLASDRGIGPFVDNYIVVLAARYGAQVTSQPFPRADATQREAWNQVSKGVCAALMHRGAFDSSERQELMHIDPLSFSPEVCHHRASYILWRSRREATGDARAIKQKPSRFDVTRDSLSAEIHEIYESARSRLPTIDRDDDDEADEGVVEPIHIYASKTADELARDQRIAEAEDELMRKIQELQVEFFGKHRKWVEVPLPTASGNASATSSPQPSPQKRLPAAAVERTENFCIANINRKMLVEITPEELAVVFDALDISEHKPAFKRTSGRVLRTLQRYELQERFGADREACDILWTWIQDRSSAPASKSSTPTKSSSSSHSNDDAARKQVSAMLDMFRKLSGAAAVPQPAQHYLDPLANLKRAMNPNRPLRPSEMDYEHEEAEAARNDDGRDPTNIESAFTGAAQRALQMDPRRGAAPAASSNHKMPAAPAPAVAAPSRGNRWQIVEYSDEEEEDEDE